MPPKNSAASTRKKPTAPPPKKAASTTKINQQQKQKHQSRTTAKKNINDSDNNNSEQPGEHQQQQQQQEAYYTGLAGDLIVELKATRRELLELKSKVKNEQDRNGAVIDRIAHLLDKEYRRRRRQEKETLERRAARRRQREEDEEDEEDEEEESDDEDGENANANKRKKNQRRTDQDTTSEAEAAQQRKQNRWDFDLPDTLPVTRQNLALYNLVQSLKEAQDSGVCVFRVLDYIRAGIVPSYGDSSDGESCPGGNQKMMPIRTKDGRRQVPLLICDKTNHSGGHINNNGSDDDGDGTGRMVYSQQQIDEIKAVARTNAFQELYNMVLQHEDEKKRKEEEEHQEDDEEATEEGNQADDEKVENEED